MQVAANFGSRDFIMSVKQRHQPPLESPLIVSDLSDTLRECSNVEETRNPMQTFNQKKCSHFSQTNLPPTFPHEFPKCVSNNITYQSRGRYAYCDNSLQARSHGTYPSAACKHARPSLLHAHFCLREYYITNRGFGSMRAKMCSQTRVKVKNGSQTTNCISQTRKITKWLT